MKNHSDELIVSQSELVHLAICAEASQICQEGCLHHLFYRKSNLRFDLRLPTR